ncbi:MAG TPA: papain-like cysteine protease family protein [Alphaproteobacteria bacterium]
MRRPLVRLMLLGCLAATPAAAQMQSLPPPVDLGIRNIMQDTDVWCWAAVAQQVIIKRKGRSPPQCALVAMVHGRYPSFCCPHYERCAVAGSLRQIQILIRNFGQRTTSLSPPTDAMSLYRTLRAGRPIILAIRNSPYTGHVVVLTGMSWTNGANGPEAILHVNDPLQVIPDRLSFRALVPRWRAALVVY